MTKLGLIVNTPHRSKLPRDEFEAPARRPLRLVRLVKIARILKMSEFFEEYEDDLGLDDVSEA